MIRSFQSPRRALPRPPLAALREGGPGAPSKAAIDLASHRAEVTAVCFTAARFTPSDDPGQLEACRAYARMINTLNADHLEPWLRDDLTYTSQFVFEDMEGKTRYMDYIRKKLDAIRRSGIVTVAEIAYTDIFGAGHCVAVGQDEENGKAFGATLLIKMKDGKIREMSMCGVPAPSECRLTGERPT